MQLFCYFYPQLPLHQYKMSTMRKQRSYTTNQGMKLFLYLYNEKTIPVCRQVESPHVLQCS